MLSLSLADGDADGDAAFFNTSYPLVDGFLAAAAEKTGRGVVYSCSWPAYTASGHGLPIQYDPWHERSFAHLSLWLNSTAQPQVRVDAAALQHVAELRGHPADLAQPRRHHRVLGQPRLRGQRLPTQPLRQVSEWLQKHRRPDR